jgi:hypothetical protein
MCTGPPEVRVALLYFFFVLLSSVEEPESELPDVELPELESPELELLL